MDQKRRDVLKAAYNDLLAQMADLQVALRVLAMQLGEDLPGAPADTGPVPAVGSGEDPASRVNQGEFHGYSSPKATHALLERVGRTRPLKTLEILEAIRKGGVQLGGKSPEGTLYKSLDRDERFTKVGRGFWGLSDWYPARPRKAETPTVPEVPEVIARARPESNAERVAQTESERRTPTQ
jgi:hypothetical protein